MAYEKVTLYGVPIVAQRKVNYGRIDPETSRDPASSATPSWRATGARTTSSSPTTAGSSTEVEELEHRARRRDILVDDETLFATSTTSGCRPTWCPARTSTPGGSAKAP